MYRLCTTIICVYMCTCIFVYVSFAHEPDARFPTVRGRTRWFCQNTSALNVFKLYCSCIFIRNNLLFGTHFIYVYVTFGWDIWVLDNNDLLESMMLKFFFHIQNIFFHTTPISVRRGKASVSRVPLAKDGVSSRGHQWEIKKNYNNIPFG